MAWNSILKPVKYFVTLQVSLCYYNYELAFNSSLSDCIYCDARVYLSSRFLHCRTIYLFESLSFSNFFLLSKVTFSNKINSSHPFVTEVYIALFHGYYSEVLPTRCGDSRGLVPTKFKVEGMSCLYPPQGS